MADQERIIETEKTDSTGSFEDRCGWYEGEGVSVEGGTVPWTEKIWSIPQVEGGFEAKL